jgi:hypothetical protein
MLEGTHRARGEDYCPANLYSSLDIASMVRAILVHLAEREGLTTILTVDRDFEVYRIGGRKAFRVLPKR